MRSDYALYTVAIIFFIISLTVLIYQVELKELWTITTVVLGLFFIGLGYTQRPKRTLESKTEEKPLTSPVSIGKEKPEVELTEVKGIGLKRAEQLKALGIKNVKDLAEASVKDLAVKLKVSPKITKKWIENAKKLVKEN